MVPDLEVGGRGNDILIGLGGNDVQIGDDGDDIFIGGVGADVQFGGRGNDISIWAPGDGSDAFIGGPGRDALVVGLIDRDPANTALPLLTNPTNGYPHGRPAVNMPRPIRNIRRRPKMSPARPPSSRNPAKVNV